MILVRRAALAGLFLAFGSACTSEEPQTEEELVGSKEDAIPDTGGPADCFNCDPANLKSAMEQVGLGRRFLKAGDAWVVAFKFRESKLLRKELQELPIDDEHALLSPGRRAFDPGDKDSVYLFDYYVTGVSKRILGTYRRSVAKIRMQVQYDRPSGAEDSFDDVLSTYRGLVATVPPSAHEFKLELELSDLLSGLGKTYYTSEYPNGRRVDAAGDAALRSVTDAFPTAIPNVDKKQTAIRKLPAVGNGAGQLAPELKALADKAATAGLISATWQTRDYRYFVMDLDTDPADGQDVGTERVWWAVGEAWPFLTMSERGQALAVTTQGL